MPEMNLRSRLRALGIGPTRQRLRIAEVMLRAERHFSAEQLMRKVNADKPSISKATIYNTLRLFTDHGLLREVIVDPQRVYYDSRVEPHHHFYNPRNGEIIDIPAEQIRVSGLPTPPADTELDGIEIIVRLRESRPIAPRSG